MSDKSSELVFPDELPIKPLDRPPHATIRVPGSKSITNRALVLAALTAKGFASALRGALRSEDTEVMIECLQALGFRVLTDWPTSVVCVQSDLHEPTIPVSEANLFVANSGTTMRFLTALVSLGHGRYRLDGVPRMRERPIEDLLLALRQLGVRAFSEKDNGCPPVIVETQGLSGGFVRIKGNTSSQFLSGLLMAATRAQGPLTIEIDGPIVSRPYVDMTLRMLDQWPLSVLEIRGDPTRFYIPGGAAIDEERLEKRIQSAAFHEGFDPRRHMLLQDYEIEPDASAASYFWGAAAITGGEVTVSGLNYQALQGDVRFVDLLEEMGCRLKTVDAGLIVRGGPLHGVDVDMNAISDTVMTLAAVALFAKGPTTIRNVAHIRHKETDRLSALASELRRLGATVDEFADGLTITPGPLHGATVETYNDHRTAMSLALIGLRVPGVIIKNPACVTKTYPRFFEDLERLRAG